MAEEKKEDLKNGEEKNTKGADQPQKKPTDSGAGKQKPEEKVEISKSELEKLQKDAGLKESYRKGLIRINRARGRILPGSEPEEEPKKKEEEELDEFGEPIKKKKTEEFVTKKDLAIRDEKAAIAEACENEEIALNWEDIIIFYVPPKENTKEAKKQAIFDAHRRWRAEQGISEEKPKDEGKKDTGDLATDKGLRKGKEKDTGQKPEKKSIIPKKEKMEDWYK